MIRFRSVIGASSPGVGLEKTKRSVWSGAIPTDAFAGAAPPPPPAGVPPEEAGEARPAPGPDGAHALLLLSARPAITHGVVSDFTSTTLPGGWLIEIEEVEDGAAPK